MANRAKGISTISVHKRLIAFHLQHLLFVVSPEAYNFTEFSPRNINLKLNHKPL